MVRKYARLLCRPCLCRRWFCGGSRPLKWAQSWEANPQLYIGSGMINELENSTLDAKVAKTSGEVGEMVSTSKRVSCYCCSSAKCVAIAIGISGIGSDGKVSCLACLVLPYFHDKQSWWTETIGMPFEVGNVKSGIYGSSHEKYVVFCKLVQVRSSGGDGGIVGSLGGRRNLYPNACSLMSTKRERALATIWLMVGWLEIQQKCEGTPSRAELCNTLFSLMWLKDSHGFLTFSRPHDHQDHFKILGFNLYVHHCSLRVSESLTLLYQRCQR